MAGPSKGSKPDKILRDALIIELNRLADYDDAKKIKKVNRVVHKLVEAACDGKIDAIKEVWDRVEGKPSQSIGQDPELPSLHPETVIRPPLTRDEWLKEHGLLN